MIEEVIKPEQSQGLRLTNEPIEKERMDTALGLKNVEFAEYLGEDMFDMDVADKIEELVDWYGDTDALMEADINLGTKNGMTRLDKLYSYVLLAKQEEELVAKQALIRKAKEEYESSNSSL